MECGRPRVQSSVLELKEGRWELVNVGPDRQESIDDLM